jgi:hypothetical protein
MTWTLAFAVTFLVLLVFEWRTRSRLLRLLTIVMALGLFGFSIPNPYRALRHAMVRERVTQNILRSDHQPTEFESGLFTMYRAMQDDIEIGAWDRAVSFGALTWLAFSPLLRRGDQRAGDSGTRSHAQESVPGPSGLTSA